MDDARTLLARDAKLRRGVLAYAIKLTRQVDRAQAAAQEAFTRVLAGKGWHAWDPAGTRSLFSHLCDLVDDVVRGESSRASNRREVGGVPDVDEKAADSSPRIDQRAEALEAHQERLALAREVMSRLDERARRMLELEQEGIHDAAVQADRLGCEPKDIYKARERVAYHRDAVLREHARRGDPE